MCGIVGYVGHEPAAPVLLRALHNLEYRGYDSAGIAVLADDGRSAPVVQKRQGKLANLEAVVAGATPLLATTGIGHTRWATHGQPSDANAHPHSSCDGEVVVIHNGIVENYAALRMELQQHGHEFRSETDTETIAHLMEERIGKGDDLLEALRQTCGRLEGSQAILAMSPTDPSSIVAARCGNAGGIVVGFGEGEMLVASDLAAILPHTQRVAFLADGQLAHVTGEGIDVIGRDGSPLLAEVRTVPIDPVSALKGQHPHFMLKEILEQPESLADTIQSLVTAEPANIHLDNLGVADARLAAIDRVVLIGMGTSLHAAMVGRRYFEELARVPAETDNASEFRYRDLVFDEHMLVVSVSQSGETVDVLEAMAAAKAAGALQVTICNTDGAQTTRVADGTVYTRAGLERGVASTKCFLTAIAALHALALRLAQAKGQLSPEQLRERIGDLLRLPDAVARALAQREQVRHVAATLQTANHLLFLGRGLAFPVAMEGALKMKEISYIHAEGYAAGEMKHGPIALIDPAFPSIAVSPKHALRSKMVSNIEQLQARGGPVVAVVTEGDSEITALVSSVIEIPEVSALLEPLVATVPLQLLAYEVAVARGCDVDQPRNLAKTVTVE